MPKQYNPGDTIEVQVNGRTFVTVIDPHGVQRFKKNVAVDLMQKGTSAVFDNTHMKGLPLQPGNVDMNRLRMLFLQGQIPLEDYIEFHTLIGYSVCGFEDALGGCGPITIVNPVWND